MPDQNIMHMPGITQPKVIELHPQTRECRECGTEFDRPTVPPRSKWGLLCDACLRWHV